MKVLLRHKLEIGLGILIVLVYFLLRLPHLTLQPIFADEAIYIRWAQIMKSEPTLRFISLTDGKTPLFMWLMIPFFKVFKDPLMAGRFLSVVSGFFTLAGVFALSWKVFGKRVAFWSAFIYAIVPYTVFFDRMALVDSMLAAFTIWSIYFGIWLLKSQRLDLAMVLGYLLGGAWLTKTPAFTNLLALPLTIIGFKFRKDTKPLIKLALCWIVAISIALVMYNLLRLGPGFQQLSTRDSDYIFAPSDLISRPLDPFIPHLLDMFDWFPKLITWPILIFVFLGIIVALLRKERQGWAVLIWTAVPLILLTAFLKTFTARYLLLGVPPLLVFAGLGIESLFNVARLVTKKRSTSPSELFRGSLASLVGSFENKNYTQNSQHFLTTRALAAFLVVVILILPLNFDYLLVTNPQAAPLPKEERKGYLEEWTAGYGFKEIANFLLDQKSLGSVVVGTEGSFGTLPDGLTIYLDKANIPIVGGTATISAGIRDAATRSQTYFIGNQSRIGTHLSKVKLIKTYEKATPLDGSPQDAIVVYQVLP